MPVNRFVKSGDYFIVDDIVVGVLTEGASDYAFFLRDSQEQWQSGSCFHLLPTRPILRIDVLTLCPEIARILDES